MSAACQVNRQTNVTVYSRIQWWLVNKSCIFFKLGSGLKKQTTCFFYYTFKFAHKFPSNLVRSLSGECVTTWFEIFEFSKAQGYKIKPNYLTGKIGGYRHSLCVVAKSTSPIEYALVLNSDVYWVADVRPLSLQLQFCSGVTVCQRVLNLVMHISNIHCSSMRPKQMTCVYLEEIYQF